jgi:hypothetical protein
MRTLPLALLVAFPLVACGGGTPAPAATPAASQAPVASAAPTTSAAATATAPTPTASAAPVASAAPTAPAAPAGPTNMVDGRPFEVKSAFYVNRDWYGKKLSMFILYGNDKITCAEAKASNSVLMKRDPSFAHIVFITPAKEGTLKVGGATSATMAQGAATWDYPKTEKFINSSGNMNLNSGSITIAKVTPTSAEITVEAGDDSNGTPAKSLHHYLKGTFPVTFCK